MLWTLYTTAAIWMAGLLSAMAFQSHSRMGGSMRTLLWEGSTADRESTIDDETVALSDLMNSKTAAQFQVKTCSETSCSQKRKVLGLDEYATFSAFYTRASDTAVTVEETSCLGRCKFAPCVAIEHEDYEGTVSLEGMTQQEFSDRVFQKIVDENDADRVWSSVVNAIEIMTQEDEEE